MFLGKIYKAIKEIQDKIWNLKESVRGLEAKQVSVDYVDKRLDAAVRRCHTRILDEIIAVDPTLGAKLFEYRMRCPDCSSSTFDPLNRRDVTVAVANYNRLLDLAFPKKKEKKAR